MYISPDPNRGYFSAHSEPTHVTVPKSNSSIGQQLWRIGGSTSGSDSLHSARPTWMLNQDQSNLDSNRTYVVYVGSCQMVQGSVRHSSFDLDCAPAFNCHEQWDWRFYLYIGRDIDLADTYVQATLSLSICTYKVLWTYPLCCVRISCVRIGKVVAWPTCNDIIRGVIDVPAYICTWYGLWLGWLVS